MKLSKLTLGETAYIESIDPSASFTQRLIEMGFSKGSEVEVAIKGVSKHLKAYKIKNTIVALRDETADKINVIFDMGR